jgi:hypothetical protein
MEYIMSDEFLVQSWPWGTVIIWVVGFITVYFTVEQKEYKTDMVTIFFLGVFWQYALVFGLFFVCGLALAVAGRTFLWIFTYAMNIIFSGTRGIK